MRVSGLIVLLTIAHAVRADVASTTLPDTLWHANGYSSICALDVDSLLANQTVLVYGEHEADIRRHNALLDSIPGVRLLPDLGGAWAAGNSVEIPAANVRLLSAPDGRYQVAGTVEADGFHCAWFAPRELAPALRFGPALQMPAEWDSKSYQGRISLFNHPVYDPLTGQLMLNSLKRDNPRGKVYQGGTTSQESQRASSVVAVFDSTGALLGEVGRSGEMKPGGVLSAQRLWLDGDTLFIADGVLKRVSRFRRDTRELLDFTPLADEVSYAWGGLSMRGMHLASSGVIGDAADTRFTLQKLSEKNGELQVDRLLLPRDELRRRLSAWADFDPYGDENDGMPTNLAELERRRLFMLTVNTWAVWKQTLPVRMGDRLLAVDAFGETLSEVDPSAGAVLHEWDLRPWMAFLHEGEPLDSPPTTHPSTYASAGSPGSAPSTSACGCSSRCPRP